ncbi:STY0301 family protein [Pseudoduganella aquatica]|uniref:STY0301 family protein n=1 Tax=Pseudoduganella aquatica TaxID=2660641 RepID=UPI003899D0EE
MNITCRLLMTAAMAAAAEQGFAQQVSCPASAPAKWGIPASRLESVRVLSFPAGQAADATSSLPIMAPSDERKSNAKIHQTWPVNADAPSYRYQVDCLYARTERYLRLDVPPPAKLCTATDELRTGKFSFQCK